MAALSAARLTGWDGLLAEQRAYLDDFWASGDVELEGDLEIQQAVRFALFHVLQAGGPAGGRPNPAERLAGPGGGGPPLLGKGDLRPPRPLFNPPPAPPHPPPLRPHDS